MLIVLLSVLLSVIILELAVIIRRLGDILMVQNKERVARVQREYDEDRRSDMGWGERTTQLRDMSEMSRDIRRVLFDILTEVREK